MLYSWFSSYNETRAFQLLVIVELCDVDGARLRNACKGFANVFVLLLCADFFVLFLHIFSETICAALAKRRSSVGQL